MVKSVRKMLTPGRQAGKASRHGLRFDLHRNPILLTFALVAVLSLSAGVYFAALRPTSGPVMYPTNNGTSGSVDRAAAGAPATAEAITRAPGNAPQAVKQVALKARHPAQVAAWKAGNGGTALTMISQQIGNVLIAHGIGQYAVMLEACVRLDSAVRNANTSAPIPDAAMQTLYGKALSLLATGAANCQAAITVSSEGEGAIVTHTRASVLNAAVADFNTGVRNLYSATSTIRNLKTK